MTQQKVVARAAGIAPPVLMVHGGADQLCPLPAACAFFASLSVEDKTLKVYDELYHEVLNEPGRDQVLDDIATWIEAHL
jgi:lysophospholipase